MNIIFMGTPQFSVPILDMLHQKHHVMLVVTQPDKPVGRKKVLTPSPVKVKATALGLPVFQPAKLKNDYQMILELSPDLLITAAYGQMLPNQLLDQVTAINVHGSLLPKYRGGAPIQHALFNGDRVTGITIMYMAYQMDSGDIIRAQSIPIEPSDNYQSLSQKLSFIGTKLLDQVLIDYEKGPLKSFPQDIHQVSFAYTLKPEDELLSFQKTTEQVINRIRGLSPEPGATAHMKNGVIKVYEAKKSDIMDSKAAPGTVIMTRKQLIVKTIDGAVELLQIQVPGKKQMTAAAFLNGQTIIHEGDVFTERKES